MPNLSGVKQDLESMQKAPLTVPTDLGLDTTRDIAGALNAILADVFALSSGSRTIQGWAAGTPADSEDTLNFAELTDVRPMIETYRLEQAAEAYARMMSGKAQFRVVLLM